MKKIIICIVFVLIGMISGCGRFYIVVDSEEPMATPVVTPLIKPQITLSGNEIITPSVIPDKNEEFNRDGEDEVLNILQMPLAGKEYMLQIIGKKRDGMEIYGVREIAVYSGGTLVQSVLIQEAIASDGIDGIDEGYSEGSYIEELVALKDVNFDGYLDLEVWGWTPNNSIPYYYWCWNTETQQFDYAFCLQLTDIDEERKQLVSYVKAGGGIYYTSRYRVTKENKLELVERMTEDYRTFERWQTAYLDVVYCFPDNLIDPYDFRADNRWTDTRKYMYLGNHDFDSDGTPELIIGDGASLAVFTFRNGRVEKCTDVIMQCCWQCIDDVAFHKNTILTSCSGSDGSGYTAVTYRDGTWITAVYCGNCYSAYIDGKEATYEQFCEIVPFDPKDYEDSIKPYWMRHDYFNLVVKEGENYLFEYTWTEEQIPLDETFDFERICWTEEKLTSINVNGVVLQLPEKNVAISERNSFGIAFEPIYTMASTSHYNIYRSLDGGITWELIVEDFIKEIADFAYVDIVDKNTILCYFEMSGVTEKQSVYVSKDGGMTWTSVGK